ncbi:MAG: IS110 family transposase [Candidatus Rifleibacteriota bacterium]
MKARVCLGIDVSKKFIDCCLYDGKKFNCKRFEENSQRVVDKLIKHFDLKSENCLVVMESTGIYHTKIAKAFNKKSFVTVVENPLVIKAFAAMIKTKAKTDVFDAKVLARYGFERDPDPGYSKADYQMELRAILNLIHGYQKDVTRMANRLEALQNGSIHFDALTNSLWDKIKILNNDIKELKKLLCEVAKSNRKRLYELYLTIPGVGEMLAATIIAVYEDFSKFESAKKAISYAGLCPDVFISGTSVKKKPKITKKGNRIARKALFMSSLSASNYNPACKRLYQRLVEKGKNGRIALIAVSNKLLRQAFALAKSGKKFDPDYQKKLNFA